MVGMLKKASLGLLITIIASGAVMAQGEAGADCLIIPPSARANGMGQTYVSMSEDATGIWWNPAGMAFIDNIVVDLMHTQLVPDLASDVFYEYVGAAFKVEGIGTVGAAIVYLTYGDYEVTRLTPDPIGTASAWEVCPTVSGAVKIMDSIGIGMNLKFVYISLAPEWAAIEGQAGKGHSVAVDIGGLWKVPEFNLLGYRISRLNIGACVSNLGPSVTFINADQAASLPRNLRVGFSYVPVSSPEASFMIASEVNRPLVEFDRSNTYHVGGEFLYINLIAVRAGYIHDRDGNIKDPTYGLGFVFNKKVRIDWASIPQSRDLGRVHRWSVGVTF